MSDFSSGHDLTVCELEPHIGLCADSSEPAACLGFCVSLSLSLPLPCSCLSLSLSKIKKKTFKKLKNKNRRGTWVAQSVKHPTSAQVMISRFMGLSPTSGSLLSWRSPLWLLCPCLSSLSAPPLLTHSLSKINKYILKISKI